MRIRFSIMLLFYALCNLQAQVTVSTDFTAKDDEKAALHNIWDVANRISPRDGVSVRDGFEVNVVRMVGGINKIVDGKRVPDLAYDPCHYDSTTNTYVYNWTPLLSRIDGVRKSDIVIKQLVLDQPPWAFQHGYTFIPDGQCDSVHFCENEWMTTYGNSLPPADKVAYYEFIKAMMQELVATYGEDEVLSWRFRVGSEIETPDHWRGSKQDFIEHFANTEKAIRAVLPEAKIGVHTRGPSFVYKKGKELNYKGEIFASFANDLIEYCYANDVQYDFWGVSDYPLINDVQYPDLSEQYDTYFAPLVEHPHWNNDAVVDMMEYAVITSMRPDGRGFINVASSHLALVNLVHSHFFYRHYDNGFEKIYRWGNKVKSTDPPSISVLNTMEGKTRFETEIVGQSATLNNKVDAIFAVDQAEKAYDVLLYNYNTQSLDYAEDEKVSLCFVSDVPVGTKLKYRQLNYGKAENDLQCFLENEPEEGWVIDGLDRNGDPSRILNDAGKAAWRKYENPHSYAFSKWTTIKTKARTDGQKGSLIKVETLLPSFAFQKFEFRVK